MTGNKTIHQIIYTPNIIKQKTVDENCCALIY